MISHVAEIQTVFFIFVTIVTLLEKFKNTVLTLCLENENNSDGYVVLKSDTQISQVYHQRSAPP